MTSVPQAEERTAASAAELRVGAERRHLLGEREVRHEPGRALLVAPRGVAVPAQPKT